MIAVCIPSRGLMYSRTVEDVVNNLYGKQWYFVFAHSMPQPDAENHMVAQALSYKPDYLWLVDDDMQFPRGILDELLAANADVAVADYPVARNQHTVHIRNGVFEAAGMGCVLVKPQVFEKLDQPYFRCDIQYLFNGVELEPKPLTNREPAQVHGLHDIDWWYRVLRIPDIRVEIINTTAGQYVFESANAKFEKYGNHTHQSIDIWRFE